MFDAKNTVCPLKGSHVPNSQTIAPFLMPTPLVDCLQGCLGGVFSFVKGFFVMWRIIICRVLATMSCNIDIQCVMHTSSYLGTVDCVWFILLLSFDLRSLIH